MAFQRWLVSGMAARESRRSGPAHRCDHRSHCIPRADRTPRQGRAGKQLPRWRQQDEVNVHSQGDRQRRITNPVGHRQGRSPNLHRAQLDRQRPGSGQPRTTSTSPHRPCRRMSSRRAVTTQDLEEYPDLVAIARGIERMYRELRKLLRSGAAHYQKASCGKKLTPACTATGDQCRGAGLGLRQWSGGRRGPS